MTSIGGISNNSNLKLSFRAGIGLRGVASYLVTVIKKGVKFTSGFWRPWRAVRRDECI